MNADTLELITRNIAVAQQHLDENDGFAVAQGDDETAFVGEYWGGEEAFELQVASHLPPETRRVVFSVPLVTRVDEVQQFRPPNGQLAPGEIEQLYMIACDLDDGIDIIRVPITRDPAPELGDIQIYRGKFALQPTAPGYRLIMSILPNGEAE